MAQSSSTSHSSRTAESIELICEQPLPAWLHIALFGCIVLLILGLSVFQVAFPRFATTTKASVAVDRR
jgi:hypothetical protein